MFLERRRCEHQLCGFAIQSQLFWESLNWLAGCPTDISTGCVLKCFGWWYLRKSGLNSIFFIFIILWAARCTYIIYANSWITPPRAFFSCTQPRWKFFLSLPLLWLTSCWPSVGWTATPDWLGSKKGTSECQGNTGTDRGSTLVHTVGTWGEGERVRRREREREKSETPSSRSIWVSQTANRR